jgi:hypothetical protein
MNKNAVYFENLSLKSFYSFLIKNYNLRNSFINNSLSIYYVEATFLFKKIIILILKIYKIKVERLDFQMIDIKDDNGELIRYRIPRKDLFLIQDKIINSPAYKSLHHETWDQGRISNYLTKLLASNSIMDEQSSARIMYIIWVVHWHMQKNFFNQSIFVITKRPWFNIYEEYATKYNIELEQVNKTQVINMKYIRTFLRSNFILYGLARYIKYKQARKVSKKSVYNNQLYIDGRGDLDFNNDGNHSDFFWFLNSSFPAKNILYKYFSNKEKIHLQKNNINAVPEGVAYEIKAKRNYEKPQMQLDSRFREESATLDVLLKSYDLDRYYWGNFFKTYGVKIYLTWEKTASHQMAIADAIRDNGGVSAVWQKSFVGFSETVFRQDYDVSFCYSNFSHKIDTESGATTKYNVITGYSNDYAQFSIKKQAAAVRKKLLDNGAKNIVCVLDENSNDDSRWHTGHHLQRENYSYILEKVLEIPWLGVVFKPKNAVSLRARLGPVNLLLEKAEETGRCYIYETIGRLTTIASPVLAALSADLCISGHIGGGTAALECVIAGIPTLLIDREGCPASKLYELPVGKVIFKNWPTTIDSVMENFNTPGGIDGFGDWSSIIGDLDPFRDGKAANRMGTYLHWLNQGFEEGLDRHAVMENAAERYKKKWGDDKVIIL